MKEIDKTYITKCGKDILNSKRGVLSDVHISEHNQKIADRRIREWEKQSATLIHNAQFHFARVLKKK